MRASRLSRIIYLALLVSFGLILHIVEQGLPNPFVLPGVKLGLANIITLLALVLYGFRSGLLVSLLRTILGSLFAGTFLNFPFLLSFSGALVSTVVMGIALILRKRGVISLVGVSLLGASFHNMTQLSVASLFFHHAGIFFFYFPILMLFAIPTGFATGLVTTFLEKLVRKNLSHITNSSH